MIKGILSLFTSGAIFNPMVLIGIAFGIFLNIALPYEQIMDLYQGYHIYVMALFIATLYVWFFKRVYKFGGRQIDYFETGLLIVGSALKLLLSSVLIMLFITFLFF